MLKWLKEEKIIEKVTRFSCRSIRGLRLGLLDERAENLPH